MAQAKQKLKKCFTCHRWQHDTQRNNRFLRHTPRSDTGPAGPDHRADSGTAENHSYAWSDIVIGAVGVITVDNDAALWTVTGTDNGLIYCRPLQGRWQIRIVLPDQFWSLIDHMP